MGQLYSAVDTRLGRRVAIKVLATHLLDDAELRLRFDREARAAAAVNHPNICTVFDIGWQGDTPFIVMEYLDGQSLAARLALGPLEPNAAIAHAIQIAHALRETHKHGVIHRDLKPSNVMLTALGVKVVDFGVAKLKAEMNLSAASTRGPDTEPGTILGTLQYMAPEQLEGSDVDERVDVFSLGALLYEMLTGTAAFAAPTKAAVIAAILSRSPAPPSSVVPQISREVDAIVLDCLAKGRDARPTSDTLVDRLEAAAQMRSRSRPRKARQQHRPIRAIAVLPVEANIRSESAAAFSDGVTDGLISALVRFRALRVISRASCLKYRASSLPLAQIGRELKVDAVLVSSINEDETGKLTLTTELIDAATESRAWSGSYAFERSSVLQIQEQVGDDIASQIHLSGSTAQARRGRRPVVSQPGHAAYLKARFCLENRIGNWVDTSFEALQTAIAHDPDFAPAHAALSKWYVLAAARKPGSKSDGVTAAISWADGLRRAEEEARVALTLDPRLGEAHSRLASVLCMRWQFDDAERSYLKALALEPNAVGTHTAYSEFLTFMGRFEEALVHLEAAKQRDPFATSLYERFAVTHYAARDFVACAAAVAAGLELGPASGVLAYFKGQAESHSGNVHDAVATLRTARTLMADHPAVVAALAAALVRAGQRDEAEALLSALVERTDDVVHISEVHAALGNTGDALDALEVGYQRRSPELLNLAADPAFDPLRRHPRFIRLLREIGLPTLNLETH